MRQYADEMECVRLGGELRLHMSFPSPDHEKMVLVRKNLLAAHKGKEPTLSFGAGAFSGLYNRFESVLATVAKADRHFSARDKLMAELGDGVRLSKRAVRAGSIVNYAFNEPKPPPPPSNPIPYRASFWPGYMERYLEAERLLQTAGPPLDRRLVPTDLIREELGPFVEEWRGFPWRRVAADNASELFEVVRIVQGVETAWEKFLAANPGHRVNLEMIRSRMEATSMWKENARKLTDLVSKYAVCAPEKLFDPVQAKIDFGKDRTGTPLRIDEDWEMSKYLLLFQVKKMELHTRSFRGRFGAKVPVPSFEVTFKPAIPKAAVVVSGTGDKLGHVRTLKGERPASFEIRMQSFLQPGFDTDPSVVILADGSAEVTRQFAPFVEFLERWSHDFDHVSGCVGVLAKRCIFCNLPLTGDETAKRGYGETCRKKFAVPNVVKALPLPKAPELLMSWYWSGNRD